MKSDKLFYVIVTLVTVLVFGAILFLASRSNHNPSTTAQNDTANHEEELLQMARNATHNPSEAIVTIAEFGDFQCPACKESLPYIKKVTEDFGDKVSLIFYNFPLTNIHNYAYGAAIAAEAAANQGKFFEYHDLLYLNQRKSDEKPMIKADFVELAKELDLNIDQFEKDLDSEEVKSRLDKDMDLGNKLGVNSTPTLYVNGIKIPNVGVLYDTVKTEIDKANPQENSTPTPAEEK